MKTRFLALVLTICFTLGHCSAQGMLQITFDGPPVQPPDSAYSITNYSESGMLFLGTLLTNGPLPTFDHFGRVGPASGSNSVSQFAYDGTAYLENGRRTLMFSFTNGSVFGLLSVDLAEYSTVFSNEPVKVPFIGYEQGGATVTNVFTTDGIIDGTGPLADFQTFYFTNFTDLTRVEIPGPTDPLSGGLGWSLDNLVVSIPEPTIGGLLLAGGLALSSLRFRNRHRK